MKKKLNQDVKILIVEADFDKLESGKTICFEERNSGYSVIIERVFNTTPKEL